MFSYALKIFKKMLKKSNFSKQIESRGLMNEKQFEERLALLDQLQSACTQCGLCSEACATFQSTGWEHESPRGRLHLAARFLHGHIHPKSEALSTFDRCLGCQACEPLCPHQVSYRQVRQVVQELRRELQLSSSSAIEPAQYQQWITLAQRMSNIWWRRYGAKWLKIPFLDFRSTGSFAKKCKHPQAGQPVLAVCCVQDLFQHDAIEQALAFVHRLGYSLEVDRNQPCCGAIFERLVQGGEETICYPEKQRKAASLQHKAHHAFLRWMPSQTYFLSRGCQCFISKQKACAGDFYAWIEELLHQQKLTLYFPQQRVVYYQAYCQSQKGREDSIWRLLQRIQGLIVQEVPHPQTCCGGYCGEIFLHSKHAQNLVEKKILSLPRHATLVVTSPDCWGLFKSHPANEHLIICYPIQILMEACVG